jgi:hypothetical protein
MIARMLALLDSQRAGVVPGPTLSEGFAGMGRKSAAVGFFIAAH